jgi:hypothetical protein
MGKCRGNVWQGIKNMPDTSGMEKCTGELFKAYKKFFIGGFIYWHRIYLDFSKYFFRLV